MDNTDEVSLDKWIFIDPVEVTEFETPNINEHQKNTPIESDLESDGISIISHNESSAEEEYLQGTGSTHDIENVKLDSKENTMKWTLADSEINSDVLSDQPSRTFFLNCSEEPVQELSEHELGSIQSDLESDEVISRIENNVELETKSIKNKNLTVMMEIPNQLQQHLSGLVISTIVLAAISMFLGHYMYYTDQIEDKKHDPKKNFDNILKESFDNIDEISKKYNVSTTLYLCEQKYRSGNNSMEQNIHKCLIQVEADVKKRQDNERKREIKEMAKNLKMKERYLNEKEKFLIQREYNLLNAENKFKKIKNQQNIKKKNTHSKFDSGQESFKTELGLENEKKRVQKDIFESNIKSKNEIYDRNSKNRHWKNNRDRIINFSKEVLRTIKLNFDTEREKYFKFKKGHKKKYEDDHKPKKDKSSKNVQAIAINEEHFHKSDKAKRKRKY